MSTQAENGTKECLSPGTVMALLDQQLGAEEAGRIQSHLQACPRCRHLAADLGAAAQTVAGLRCLDQEAIAAWVDYQAGRARGRVSKAEMRRRGEHLRQCQRCQQLVEELAAMCAPQGLWGRMQYLLAAPMRTWPPEVGRGLRWAGVATIVLIGVLLLYVMGPGRRLRPGPSASQPRVVSRPGGQGAQAERQTAEQSTRQARAPREAGVKAALPAFPRPGPTGKPRTGRRPEAASKPLPQPEAALIPGDRETQAAIARASADLARARARRNAGAEATAALELGGLYHEGRDYRSAARCYHGASAAAEKAGKSQVRVDALILEGAALAELGDEVHARQQLGLALGLARKVGYEQGEQNALTQLELLEGQRGREH